MIDKGSVARRMEIQRNDCGVLEENKKTILHALNLLKVIAIILVFNSHCSALYPNSYFATGGALGNSLFFVLSGFLLKIRNDTNFKSWIKKRFFQLYPGMWIVSVINMVVFNSYPEKLYDALYRFVWPTGFWFVGGLFLFNVIIFLLERLKVFDSFIIYSVAVWLLYFVSYCFFVDKTGWHVEDHNLFRLIYYFYIYSAGYCISTKRLNIKLGTRTLFILAIIGFILNIGWKFLLVKSTYMMSTQFICQLACVLWAIGILSYGLRIENQYCSAVPNRAQRTIDFWSRYSLEIYFSQRLPQGVVSILNIIFPVNLVLAITITLIYALPIKWVIQKISQKFLL